MKKKINYYVRNKDGTIEQRRGTPFKWKCYDIAVTKLTNQGFTFTELSTGMKLISFNGIKTIDDAINKFEDISMWCSQGMIEILNDRIEKYSKEFQELLKVMEYKHKEIKNKEEEDNEKRGF